MHCFWTFTHFSRRPRVFSRALGCGAHRGPACSPRRILCHGRSVLGSRSVPSRFSQYCSFPKRGAFQSSILPLLEERLYAGRAVAAELYVVHHEHLGVVATPRTTCEVAVEFSCRQLLTAPLSLTTVLTVLTASLSLTVVLLRSRSLRIANSRLDNIAFANNVFAFYVSGNAGG